MILLRESTEEAKLYRQQIRSILAESDSLDASTVKDSFNWADRLRESLIGRIQIEAQRGWHPTRVPQIMAGVGQVVATWKKDYQDWLHSRTPEAYRVGLKIAESGAQAAGLGGKFPDLSAGALDSLSRVPAAPVETAAKTALAETSKRISVALFGGKSPEWVADQLLQSEKHAGTPWNRVVGQHQTLNPNFRRSLDGEVL